MCVPVRIRKPAMFGTTSIRRDLRFDTKVRKSRDQRKKNKDYVNNVKQAFTLF